MPCAQQRQWNIYAFYQVRILACSCVCVYGSGVVVMVVRYLHVVCVLFVGGVRHEAQAPSHLVKNNKQTYHLCDKWCGITYSLEYFIRVWTSSSAQPQTCMIVCVLV